MNRINRLQYWFMVIYIGVMLFGSLLMLADTPDRSRTVAGIIIIAVSTAIACWSGILPSVLNRILNK